MHPSINQHYEKQFKHIGNNINGLDPTTRLFLGYSQRQLGHRVRLCSQYPFSSNFLMVGSGFKDTKILDVD